MKISERERSYEWLRAYLTRTAYWCEKACGCDHCHTDLLDRFAFSDHAAYLIT